MKPNLQEIFVGSCFGHEGLCQKWPYRASDICSKTTKWDRYSSSVVHPRAPITMSARSNLEVERTVHAILFSAKYRRQNSPPWLCLSATMRRASQILSDIDCQTCEQTPSNGLQTRKKLKTLKPFQEEKYDTSMKAPRLILPLAYSNAARHKRSPKRKPETNEI